MKKIKVTIIQERIMHYRLPLFERLSEIYDLSILCCDPVCFDTKVSFKIKTIESKIIAGFREIKLINEIEEFKRADVLIMPFQLNFFQLIRMAIFQQYNEKRIIFWGLDYSRNPLSNIMKIILANFLPNLLFYNEDIMKSFTGYLSKKTRCYVANNTVDVKQPEKIFFDKRSDFIFVGSFDKRKKLEMLIDCVSYIRNQLGKRAGLKIIGDGEQNESLRQQVKDLNAESHIKFLGRIEDNEILAKEYESAIAHISPGQAGLSVLQSFAYGVPFITHMNAISGGEKNNIKNGVNGYFFNTKRELINIMVKLIEHKPLQKNLSLNSLKYYQSEASMDNMVKGFKDAIEDEES